MSNNSTINYFTVVYTTPSHILITIVKGILILIILVGNILTLCAITKFRSLRHQSSVMIGALAVADLLMGVVYTPISLLREHMPLLFHLKVPCFVIMYVGHFASLSAVIFLSLLSLERLYAVQFPFYYHAHPGLKGAVILNIAMFVFITISLIPLIAGAANWHEGVSCYPPTLYPSSYSRFIVAVTFIPMILGFAAFIRVSLMEFKFRKQIFDQSVALLRKQESIRTKLILTAYIVSLSFWVPHLIYYFYDTISKADRNIYVIRVVTILDLSSSAVNCFMYAWKNSKFRVAYKQLLCLNSTVPRRTSTEQTDTSNGRHSLVHTSVTIY